MPVGVGPSAPDPSLSSTETLLRNIQGLLKVAADNARQQERQVSFEKGEDCDFCMSLRLPKTIFFISTAELKMELLRERDTKGSLERQLSEEQKLRGKIKLN